MTECIGLGGGCHWCTEAVFESLRGVTRVDQGWLAPASDKDSFSEGVLIDFKPDLIDLFTLVAIHLHTHSCTSNHVLRGRYRSALYVHSAAQARLAANAIAQLQQTDFDLPIITQVCRLGAFRRNEERYLHYAQRHAGQPFCERFISPKLALLRERFEAHALPNVDQAAGYGGAKAKVPARSSGPTSTP
ncbi:MAG: peptide-methionine (S)-S-oxide reductase [Burkholderiaceae bacterium]